jgi:hypothetical protein
MLEKLGVGLGLNWVGAVSSKGGYDPFGGKVRVSSFAWGMVVDRKYLWSFGLGGTVRRV